MIPKEFKEIVLKKNQGSGQRRVHAPCDEPDVPLCVKERREIGGTTTKKGWQTKPANVIPDGFYPDCGNCLNVLDDDEE